MINSICNYFGINHIVIKAPTKDLNVMKDLVLSGVYTLFIDTFSNDRDYDNVIHENMPEIQLIIIMKTGNFLLTIYELKECQKTLSVINQELFVFALLSMDRLEWTCHLFKYSRKTTNQS